MNQKITLALIGAGERGQYCYAPYAKLHGYEVCFTAVADPHDGRRKEFMQDYQVPAAGEFCTAEELLSRPKLADAVIISTQDNQHFAYACKAIELGYAVLLEKPISPSLQECLKLQQLAEEKNATVLVCHVMRYTKFYRKIRQLLDSGTIGEVVHVNHTENVGYWHYAHSYVRGNWHKTADASPMILAKCCHDMDILSWLLHSRCRRVSSFGGLPRPAVRRAAWTAARTAAPARSMRRPCILTTAPVSRGRRHFMRSVRMRATPQENGRWRPVPTENVSSTATTTLSTIRRPAWNLKTA